MNTFPYESWDEAIAKAYENGEGFFTFGPGGSTGIWILTILGIVAMLWSWYAFVTMENKSLQEAAARLSDKYGG